MDIKQEIKLEIGYSIGSVNVYDVVNKKRYDENFTTFLPFIYPWFSKRAEKKAIKRAMDFISEKIYQEHQNLMN